MCLPKGLLKTIMALMAIASIAGGVAVMIFGGIALNSGALKVLSDKWMMYLFVFGFGSFLVIVGILQFCACKSENRCAIFTYEIFAIVTFLLFTALFIAAWVFKSSIVEIIEKATENDNSEFTRMFTGVEKNTGLLDKGGICEGNEVVQTCNRTSLETVYLKGVPSSMWFNLGALIESTVHCSGLKKKLNRYYFSTTKTEEHTIEYACKDKLIEFINDSFGSWTWIAGISIAVLFLLFLDVAAGYCLCCHPERDDNKHYGSPYSPM